MKKILICLLLVLSCLFSLVNAASKTKVEIISWQTFGDGGFLDRQKEACEAANPDIEISYITVPSSEYYTKLLTMIASGSAPDMAMLGMDWLAPYAAKGALLPLDNYIEKGFPLDDMYDSVEECLKYKGKYYALPRDTTSNVLYYNKKLFQEAELSFPTENWTWDDFLQAAKTLTKTDKSGRTIQWGFFFDIYPDGWYHWLLSNGTSFINQDFTQSTMNTPKVIETLQFLADLKLKHKVAPDAGQAKELGGSEGVFKSQRAAMYIGGVSRSYRFAEVPELEWDIAPIPYRTAKVSRVWSNLWVVPKGTKKMNAVWKVLSFYSGPQGQKIAAECRYGIPAFKSIAESPAFLTPPPEHKVYFLEAFKNGKPYPVFPQGQEYRTIMDRELDLVWAGERSVEEAARRIDEQAAKLLKK